MAALVALAFVLAAGAAPPNRNQPSGPFPVPTGTIGVAAGFEGNDGDMAARNGVPTGAPTNGGGYTVNFDWNSLESGGLKWGASSGGNQTGTGQLTGGISTNGGWKTVGLIAPIGSASGQNSFAGGTKQDNDCPSVINNGVQNKDDARAAYIATKTLTSGTLNGHTILNLAWERAPQNNTSASAHIAFEFNQNDGTNNTGCGTGSDGLVKRSTANGGDVLLVYDFTGGSNALPTISLSRWVASGACEVSSDTAPCWGTFTVLTNSPTQAEGNVDDGLSHICGVDFCGPNEHDINTSSPTAGTTYTLPGSASDCLATGSAATPSGCYALGNSEFGEGTVDLTAAGVFAAGTCESFGRVDVVSRSSGNSSQAAMEKLLGPASFTLSNCSTSTATQPQSDGTGTTASTFSDMTQGTDGTYGTVTSGTWVRDKATVTVTGTSTWSGAVQFYLCKSTTSTLTSCTASDTNHVGTFTSKSVCLPTNGTTCTAGATATSDNFRITDAGSYCWAAVFTAASPNGLPNGDPSTTGECFTATSPTSIATNPWVYPQDRAVISASSGGDVAGSVKFRLYDNQTDCLATGGTPSDTVGSGGLLYREIVSNVAGSGTPSTATVDTTNGSHSTASDNYRVTASTANNLYWRVNFTSTNNQQTNSSSACIENTGVSITADGTVSFG